MKTINMKQFIPETIVSGKKQNQYVVHIQDNKDHYYVWYERPIHNAKGLVGSRRHDEIIPKIIPLDQNTWEVLGLLQGEMSKTHRGMLTFSNCEPGIIRQVISWFENCKFVKMQEWRWYIKLNLLEPESESERQRIDELVANAWIKQAAISVPMAYAKRVTYVNKTKNKELKDVGTLNLEKANPLFVQTIQKLVSEITKSTPHRPANEIIPYLRGIIAAESCVNYKLESGHRRVFITATKEDERAIFRECLHNIGVQTKDCKPIKDIIISGRENVLKLHELKLMTLHPDKHKKFLEMLSTYTDWWHEKRKLS